MHPPTLRGPRSPLPRPAPQLTHWVPGGGVRCVGPDSDIFLRTLTPGEGWESPRPPFEVSLRLTARTASTSGQPEEGEAYYATPAGEALQCSMGAGQLPPGGQRQHSRPTVLRGRRCWQGLNACCLR